MGIAYFASIAGYAACNLTGWVNLSMLRKRYSRRSICALEWPLGKSNPRTILHVQHGPQYRESVVMAPASMWDSTALQ